jgi:hypothetical protein
MSTNTTRIELDHRSSGGIDVTLVWIPGDRDNAEETLVCVSDTREGTYFEIPTEAYLALDVFNHPFAYRDFSSLDYHDPRLAAAA